MIVSEKLIFTNHAGKRIVGFYEHLKGDIIREPFIIILPSWNKTKDDTSILSNYFIKRGFSVIRCDSTTDENGNENNTDENNTEERIFDVYKTKENLNSILNSIRERFNINLFGIVVGTKEEIELAMVTVDDGRIKFILNKEYYIKEANKSEEEPQPDVLTQPGIYIENRKFLRTSVNFPVEVIVDSPYRNFPPTIYGETTEISETGMCLALNSPIPQSLFVYVLVKFPFTRPIKIQAQVVWSKHSDIDGKTHCGVYFLGAEENQLDILRRTVVELKKGKKRKFAFVSNFRDGSDQFRPPLITMLPNDLNLGIVRNNIGHAIGSHFDVYGKVEGYTVFIFLTSSEILNLPMRLVRERILKTVLFAQNELGVDYIGLGSYTKSMTDGGLWLSAQSEVKVNLTHGDSLTSWMAIEGTKQKLNLDIKQMKVAVVGAYGLIGRTISRLLVREEPERLILVGRNKHKLRQLEEIIRAETATGCEKIIFTQEISDIIEADLIFTVTSSPTAVVKTEYLKQGAIVYDLAQPINVPPEICEQRPDILRIDGGYVKIPKIDIKADMGPPKGTTFACCAELILQCLEGKEGRFVGPVELQWVEQTRRWSRKYNFSHADLTCFSFPLPDRYIHNIASRHVTSH